MKHLLRLFFVFALVFGSANYLHAVNFHVTVLDPSNFCTSSPLPSGCIIFDSSSPFTATFSTSTCALAGVPGPTPAAPYGCLALVNLTSDPITSLNLSFSGLGELTFECDTVAPGAIFASAICGSSGGTDDFYFYNGAIPAFSLSGPSPLAIIYETGADPELFDGTGTVNTPAPVPEPSSLPLLLTGILFAGIYLGKRNHPLFAFGQR